MRHITLTNMRVGQYRVDYDFAVSEDLERFFAPAHHLFCHYDRPIDEVPEGILVIPFLGNVMQIAWLTDAVVHVDTVDSVFAESLLRLRNAYQNMYPNCPMGGKLRAKELQDNTSAETWRSAQMYTGGMDATTTYIRHREENPLLIQEYGFFDERKFSGEDYAGDEKSFANFMADQKAAKEFADAQGVDTSFMYANYGTFIKSGQIDREYRAAMNDSFWHGLHHAMAILGAAAPVAFAEGVKTLYIASSFSVGNTYPCASDPTTDNEFSFGRTTVVHDGYEMSDQDKAKTVVAYQKLFDSALPLRVCSWNDRNCCMCEKCLRRMLQICAEGGDPRQFGFYYEATVEFQLKKYLKKEVQFFTAKNINKWQVIAHRMQENYDNVFDKQAADFLIRYDFEKEKKRGLLRYYVTNFFPIVKRKLKGLFNKER